MKDLPIRFRSILFDSLKGTVRINFLCGTKTKGGHNETIELTNEKLFELVDVTKLQKHLLK